MAKRKKSISFPATATKFDIAFRALMLHLAGFDLGSLSPTVVSWTRLGISNAQYTILLAILGSATTPNTWLSVQPVQANKATRNPTSKSQLATLMKRALAIIRPERSTLKAADKLTPNFLSTDDKKCFFIPDVNPRTNSAETLRISHPVPVLDFFSTGHLEVIVDAHNPETPKSTSLPEGIVFLELFWYKGTVPPTDDSQYKLLKFSTKFRNQVLFATADIKLDCYLKGRYLGLNGEEGALSPSIHITISAKNA
ncbi:MAG TPA: hypothetical protein VF411_05335 [Bacteroidia bacterium]